jgi:hypothetical protein
MPAPLARCALLRSSAGTSTVILRGMFISSFLMLDFDLIIGHRVDWPELNLPSLSAAADKDGAPAGFPPIANHESPVTIFFSVF